jgi:hypothetical protein
MTRSKGTIVYNPVQVMEGAIPSRFGRVAIAVILAALVMLCLGSKALLTWANDLPINAVTDYILYLAQTWQDGIDKTGLTQYADAIHNALVALQALRW